MENTLHNEKIRVAVLYGGRSSEHDVSVVSATNVIMNLDRSHFEVIPIGIDKKGTWFLGDDVFKQGLTEKPTLRLYRDAERLLFNPDFLSKSLPATVTSPAKFPTTLGRFVDVVFPVIHGPLCEDGTVQGLLELADIPYVGCGVLASALGMDKDFSKRLVKSAGIAVPDYKVLDLGQWQKNSEACFLEIKTSLHFPIFVKPVNTGSSVGVSKVKNPATLMSAIENAFHYDTRVIVEQGIQGMEIEVAVLESQNFGEEPIVSIPGEIRPHPKHEFYSYASKYLDENGAELVIPAPLTQQDQENIQKVAKDIFLILQCEGMARVDLFLEHDTHKIYFNEVNSLPGFTNISMYPKLMAASGMQYSALLTHLVNLAIARHQRKSKLHRYVEN